MLRRRNGFGAPGRPWHTVLGGLLIASLSVGIYYYLTYLENQSLRAGATVRVHWLLALLYNTGGKPLAVGFFVLVGLITLGVGVAGLLRQGSTAYEPPVSHDELNALLMPVLDFTAEDLASNRQGQLTERQRDRVNSLRKQGSISTLISALVAVLSIAGIGTYALFFAPSGAALRQSILREPVAQAALGVAALLIVGSLIVAVVRNTQLGGRGLKVVEGNVKLIAKSMPITAAAVSGALGYGTRACSIRVGRTTFRVQESVLNAFKHGAVYRFYYIKHTPAHIILSVEALGGG